MVGLVPNVVFGLTAVGLKKGRKERPLEVLRHIPVQKIMMEMDAPYLVPPAIERFVPF